MPPSGVDYASEFLNGYAPEYVALEKLVYLAYRNIKKKWTRPLANWAQSAQQLAIKFGNRFQIM